VRQCRVYSFPAGHEWVQSSKAGRSIERTVTKTGLCEPPDAAVREAVVSAVQKG